MRNRDVRLGKVNLEESRFHLAIIALVPKVYFRNCTVTGNSVEAYKLLPCCSSALGAVYSCAVDVQYACMHGSHLVL